MPATEHLTAQATIGPWRADPVKDEDVFHITSEVESSLFASVAGWPSHAEANAHLIIAAPDMLTFLEGFLPTKADHDATGCKPGFVACSEYEFGHEEGDCPQDLEDDAMVAVPFGELRDLVAKARGQS